MPEQNDSTQTSSQQQELASDNLVVAELAEVRHELRELKEQLNTKKLVTSNKIAVGILKAFGVIALVYLVFLVPVYIFFYGAYAGLGSSDVQEVYPQSPK